MVHQNEAYKAVRRLENRLSNLKDDKRLSALAELAGYYTFTNIGEARKLLEEQRGALEKSRSPELLLQYHLNTAIIENQFYNFKLSEVHFLKALQLAEANSNINRQTEIFIDYAGALVNLQENERAASYLEKAKINLEAFPDPVLSARLTCREGYIWLHYKDFDQAIEFFHEAEKMYEALGGVELAIKDCFFITLIHSGLGAIHESANDMLRAVDAYIKAVQICESLGMRSRLEWHYLNVGKVYMALNDYENAEEYFLKVDQIPDDVSRSAKAYASANLGYCYFIGGAYEEALALFNKAEYLSKENNLADYENLSIVSLWKGLLYDAIGKEKKADKYLADALQYANQAGKPRQQAKVCKDIASLYAEKGDFRNAYEYQKLYSQFAEKYVEQVNTFKVKELEIKYEAEKKRREAELLRLQAAGLQMKALRAQMNPHFMFNALNSIQNYINSENSDFAAKYLAKFAKLMRANLEYSELEIISLENEIEFLKDYLVINQKLRFQDRLDFEITVDEAIEEDILGVPTMIVQPYVENAIEHGLRPQKGGKIKIDFSLMQDETMILCIIEDNGVGRAQTREWQEADFYHQKHKSRGTDITLKRLEILHAGGKEKLFVNIVDLLDPVTQKPSGTRVEIQIPVVEMQVQRNGSALPL